MNRRNQPRPKPDGTRRRWTRYFARRTAPTRSFRGDDTGVAAIEFAFILPIMIVLYFGLVELTRAIDTSRRLSLFARTVADLSGRSSTTTMDPIFNAANVILQPYDASQIKIVVNAMGVEKINGNLLGGVCSSVASSNAKARKRLELNGTEGLPSIPATYSYDGARYIIAEVTMPYVPILGSAVITGIFGANGLIFTEQVPWAQRTDKEIVLPGGTACPVYP